MEQDPSSEAKSLSPAQDIALHLRNLKDYSRVHSRPTMHCILKQMNLACIILRNFYKICGALDTSASFLHLYFSIGRQQVPKATSELS
jgi:hypothetical protein